MPTIMCASVDDLYSVLSAIDEEYKDSTILWVKTKTLMDIEVQVRKEIALRKAGFDYQNCPLKDGNDNCTQLGGLCIHNAVGEVFNKCQQLRAGEILCS